MHAYLTPKNVVETFKTSQQYTEGLTDNFPEYERIARNKPHGSIPKEYPKTTDGTTASIIRKTPHRVIQQLPTGKVTSDTNDWLSVVASFIYTNRILKNANEGYALIQKCWTVVEKFLTFGFCPTYTPFVEHGGYFCTDLRIPYWGDIFLQPGKLSDADSKYIFLRSWWQTNDIDALIASQNKLNKKTPRTWDVSALQEVRTMISTKEEKALTPAERDMRINTKGGVQLITGFQRGKGAKFYTFHVSSGKIVRTKENKDPRGEIPINFAYGDVDGGNPFGRGIIDLVGSLQNLMDGEMQMYQYNRALQLNPPLIKKGSFNKNRIKFAPNTIIDVGTEQNADVIPLKIDTTALQNFSNNYGLMKSQLINLLSSPDTSISAEVGNPGFSKTPAGVKQMQANLGIDDNYVLKQFETWYANWSETAINLYFAERTGIEELQLDKETANALRKLANEHKFDLSNLSDDNKIRIDYDSATEGLKFEVDTSTSKMEDKITQLRSLQGLTELLDKSPFLQTLIPKEQQMHLWNSIVANSGVDNPEKLSIDDGQIQESIQQMKQQEQQQQEMEQQQAQPQQPQQPDPMSQIGPDHLLKAAQFDHQKQVDLANIRLKAQQQQQQARQPATAQGVRNG